MLGSIGKLTSGITGKSASGITEGGLGLANDITGLSKSKKAKKSGSGGGGKKAAILQAVLGALGGAKG